MRVRACDRCEAHGTRLDPVDAGDLIRRERRDLHVSTGVLAGKLGLKVAHLVDLEMGRRSWTRESFVRAITALGWLRVEQAAAGLVHCCSAPCFAGEPQVGECSCVCPGCSAERAR